jgi:hypothetical protein
MASVIVEIQDIQNRYDGGDLTERYSVDYLNTQIADAVDYADTAWSVSIESRLTSGALPPGRYKRIIADAVLRVVRNPDGFTTEGDGTYSYGKRADVASGSLFFSPNDIAHLTGITGQSMPGTVGIGMDRGWHS